MPSYRLPQFFGNVPEVDELGMVATSEGQERRRALPLWNTDAELNHVTESILQYFGKSDFYNRPLP